MRSRLVTRLSRVGFTIAELTAITVVLSVIAGASVPTYFRYTRSAREASIKETLGGVRAALEQFHSDSGIDEGRGAYPTLKMFRDQDSVFIRHIEENPFNRSVAVQALKWDGEEPPVSGAAGWNYDPTSGRFWANSNTEGVGENAW